MLPENNVLEPAVEGLVAQFTTTNEEFRNGSSRTHVNLKFNGCRLPGGGYKSSCEERGLREAREEGGFER